MKTVSPPSQGVMVRLMLVLAPVMCVLFGIAVSGILSTYMKNLDLFEAGKTKKAKKQDPSYPVKSEIAGFIVLMMTFLLVTYTFHCTWVTSEAYSSPSIVLAASQHDGSRIIFDDFREVGCGYTCNTPSLSFHLSPSSFTLPSFLHVPMTNLLNIHLPLCLLPSLPLSFLPPRPTTGSVRTQQRTPR